MIHLDRPYASDFALTQAYANTTFAGEPAGWLYPDGSLSYYAPGPGAVRYDHLHSGEDRALPLGTPILAAADGVVKSAAWDPTGYGECLRIDHGEVTTLCAHLSKFNVSTGQQVKRGQLVAWSGSTGNSTGPHLHWSVIRNSDERYVNPEPYLSTQAATPAPKPQPKPADPYTPASFSVTVQQAAGVTHLYVGPSTRSPRVTDLPAGTELPCVGWAQGETRVDASTGKPDTRWYAVLIDASHHGWVASARVNGNAPGSHP